MLPGCDLGDGHKLVERLGAAAAAAQTCSAGVAEWDDEEHPQSLIHRADEALLEAKQRGPNQVALAA